LSKIIKNSVAPVIDLASEEHRATLPAGNDSIDIEAVEQEEEILAQQPTSSTASTTIVQKEAKILGKKKKLLQKGGGGCLFEVKTKKVKRSVIKEVKCEPLTNTSNSDIDLRAKPNDVMKLRNRVSFLLYSWKHLSSHYLNTKRNFPMDGFL
jgi:hypothetical protein